MGRFLAIVSASATVALLSPSCVSRGNDRFVRSTTSAANDHIMFVREDPQTFGHKRLTAMAEIYPDLGVFLSQQKFPDFVAETNKGGNRYLILYFLSSREAYACRSGEGDSRQVEFSGPYPVTDGEFRTLDQLRKKASSGGQESRKSFSGFTN